MLSITWVRAHNGGADSTVDDKLPFRMSLKAIVARFCKTASLPHERFSAEIGDFEEWRRIPATPFGFPIRARSSPHTSMSRSMCISTGPITRLWSVTGLDEIGPSRNFPPQQVANFDQETKKPPSKRLKQGQTRKTVLKLATTPTPNR